MSNDIKLLSEEEITKELHDMFRKPKPKPVTPETRRLCGDVPANLFTAFKIEVVKSGLTMAQAVEQAVKLWLQKQSEEAQSLMERANEEIKQLTTGKGA